MLRRESKLRDKTSGLLSQLDAKYNAGGGGGEAAAKQGAVRKRVKVFDDDLSEDEEETIVRGEDGWMGGSDDEESEGDGEEEDESEDESEDEDDDEDEEEDDDEDDDEGDDEVSATQPTRTSKSSVSSKTLDPLAALQASKSKEILKGRAILRQQVRPFSLAGSPRSLMSCRNT